VRSAAIAILVVMPCLRAARAADAPALPVDRAAVMADQRAMAARAGEAGPARHAEAEALVVEGVKLHIARPLLMIVAVMCLCGVPVGTALGIMLLVYLGKPETKALFRARTGDAQEDVSVPVVRSSLLPALLGVALGITLGAMISIRMHGAAARLEEPIQRGEIKRSMGDMRSIASALDAHAREPGAAAAATMEELLHALEATTPERFARANPWGHELRYEAWTDRDGRARYALG
jgi:hypothetical protein